MLQACGLGPASPVWPLQASRVPGGVWEDDSVGNSDTGTLETKRQILGEMQQPSNVQGAGIRPPVPLGLFKKHPACLRGYGKMPQWGTLIQGRFNSNAKSLVKCNSRAMYKGQEFARQSRVASSGVPRA